MDPRLDSAVARLFARILADFAYLFGDPVLPGELPALIGRAFQARLPFRGGTNGCIVLALPETLALDIAANTLGTEPTDPEAARRSEDAVKEMTSILGGHLATPEAGLLPGVELAPPELSVLDRAGWERILLEPGTQCFAVDARPALLRVRQAPGGETS